MDTIDSPGGVLDTLAQPETAFDTLTKIRMKVHSGVRHPFPEGWAENFTERALAAITSISDPINIGNVADALIYVNGGIYPDDLAIKNARRILEIGPGLRSKCGDRVQLLFAEGLAAYVVGEFDTAENRFSRMRATSGDPLLFHHTGAPAFRAEPDESGSFSPSIEWKQSANTQDYIILLSCESGYFGAYAKDFALNVRRTKRASAFHFHIVDPVQGIIDEVGMSDNRMGFSYEPAPDGNVKTYSACSRFIVARQVMEHYDRPLIICDIDVFVSQSFDGLVADCGDRIGLYLGHKFGYFPWMAILAGLSYFPNSDASKAFLAAASDHMANQFQCGVDGWMLDQVGLEVAYRHQRPKIIDLKTLGYPFKQFDNRVKRRRRARELLSAHGRYY